MGEGRYDAAFQPGTGIDPRTPAQAVIPDIEDVLRVIKNLRRSFEAAPPEDEKQVISELKDNLAAANLGFIVDHREIRVYRRCAKVDLSCPTPDHTSDIAIQVKLCKSADHVKRILSEAIADSPVIRYRFNKHIIFVVYDLGFIADEERVRHAIETEDGIKLVIVRH